MLRSGIAEPHGKSDFLRNRHTFSIATWIYIPINGVGGFHFLHTLSSICILFKNHIYLFLAASDLCFCTRAIL